MEQGLPFLLPGSGVVKIETVTVTLPEKSLVANSAFMDPVLTLLLNRV